MSTDSDADEDVPCRCRHVDHDPETGRCDHCGCPEYRPVTRYSLPPLAVKYLPDITTSRKDDP
jgi:hypothetical protein